MLNLLKNNLFDYYLRNNTCTNCLIDNHVYSSKEYKKFIEENGFVCSSCFFSFLQILEEKNNKSYKKLLKYIVENNNIVYLFPCVNDKNSEKMKQIILNSIVAAELDIE